MTTNLQQIPLHLDDPNAVQIVHGAFVYLAGVCRDCRYWEDAA